ncbi:MAG: 3-hydroxyacyl-CoA dehydrogenase, partial [Phycisphaerales bacterium]|nr:3-hydroxyacyl-CoA dehydrogenase [Phycisphaerales bacterium]
MSTISTIGVIGAGQMGGGIAQVAATSGINAILFDAHGPQLARARALHEKLMARAVEKGRMTQPDADAALKRITYVESFDDLGAADWIVEAVNEHRGLKNDLFSRLAAMFA